MEKWKKEFLTKLREEKKSYREMIDFCCDNLILNNYILEELQKNGFYFENYCGSECYYTDENGDEITENEYYKREEAGEEVSQNYIDIYQYYIIDHDGAERLGDYTEELVLYNEDLDIYILCVSHWGTSWGSVPSNWKDIE